MLGFALELVETPAAVICLFSDFRLPFPPPAHSSPSAPPPPPSCAAADRKPRAAGWLFSHSLFSSLLSPWFDDDDRGVTADPLHPDPKLSRPCPLYLLQQHPPPAPRRLVPPHADTSPPPPFPLRARTRTKRPVFFFFFFPHQDQNKREGGRPSGVLPGRLACAPFAGHVALALPLPRGCEAAAACGRYR